MAWPLPKQSSFDAQVTIMAVTPFSSPICPSALQNQPCSVPAERRAVCQCSIQCLLSPCLRAIVTPSKQCPCGAFSQSRSSSSPAVETKSLAVPAFLYVTSYPLRSGPLQQMPVAAHARSRSSSGMRRTETLFWGLISLCSCLLPPALAAEWLHLSQAVE